MLPRFLPDDWKGGFVLLLMIFVLSSFLDNIAAALIGGTIANVVFRGKVHIGYLAAIVAASNAGGSGSVVGDTTTTMMWIAGVTPLQVLEAYTAAGLAVVIFGIPAAFQQQRYSPIAKGAAADTHVDWVRVGIVAAILVTAIVVNVVVNVRFTEYYGYVPLHRRGRLGSHPGLRSVAPAALGGIAERRSRQRVPAVAGVGSVDDAGAKSCPTRRGVSRWDWASCRPYSITSRSPRWHSSKAATTGASSRTPWDSAGSMIWFGSSAGVALASQFPTARSAVAWVRGGWHVAVAYVIGFAFMLVVVGWHPDPKLKSTPSASRAPAVTQVMSGPTRTPRM